MSEKPAGDQPGSDQARTRKRIQWMPTGKSDEVEPRIDIEPESRKANSENDDRLRADKPPHWG